MRNRLAWGAALAALAVLAGCRTAPLSTPAAPPWQERRPQLQARAHYELKGRVAVAAGEQGFNARLRWTQDGAHSQLALEGPFGAGGVQISSDGHDLDILTADGQELKSDAARSELTARLEFDPPLASLRYWILGVPDPDEPSTVTRNAMDRAQQLQRGGWTIDIGRYVPVGNDWLPGQLTVQRDQVRVRIAVDHWNYPQ
jgi:outer membrane lipoprotein LolB